MQRIALILTTLALAAGQVPAQEPGVSQGPQGGPGLPGKLTSSPPGGTTNLRMAGRPGDLGTLIREQAVQEDLKLKDKQKTKLKEALAEIDSKRTEMFSGTFRAMRDNGGAPAPNGLPNREQMAAAQSEFEKQSEQAIAEVLEPRQMTRLKQIALQIEGLIAVSRPEIADKINLSYPQREAIQGILDEMREAQGELMRSLTGGTGMVIATAKAEPGGGPPRPDRDTMNRLTQMHEGRDRLRKIALQRINKILSKKQGAAFVKLMGEKFDVEKLSPIARGLPPFMEKPKPGADGQGSAPKAKDEDDSPASKARSSRAKRGFGTR